MTRYSELIKRRQIVQGSFSVKQVSDRLEIARRDLQASREVLKQTPDWAYNIAYNAMLQAGRSYMLSQGFRTRGEGQHQAVIEFLKEGLGSEHEETALIMDRKRRKRNRSIYDAVGTISVMEASQAVENAEALVDLIFSMLGDPQ